MTEGITILNTAAVTGLPAWVSVLAFVIFFIGAIVFAVSMILDGPVCVIASSLMISLIVIIAYGIFNCTVKTGEYRYECTIDDSVSYNEVVENYKIVEQRGDIWVLKDK